MKCCIRPVRAAGPNLGTQMIGDTLVVHNYGHGGSGWSLSWGSAEVAVGKALSVLPSEIAVVGCGIIGLTTAVVAQRAGLKVTIYTRDVIQRTRSFRAHGSFTPDSRVALSAPAGAGFGDLWEQMTRLSWKGFRSMLGLPGDPVVFQDAFALSDAPPVKKHHDADPAIKGAWEPGGLPLQESEWAHYMDRIKDLVPDPVMLEAAENPFPVAYTRRSSEMHFNFPSYAHHLLTEFYQRGGLMVMRDFNDPSQYGQLKEKVVINATGYAARDLWRDKTVFPVRGQTGWLVPQHDASYSLRYKNASLMAKNDGIVVMNNPIDLGEMFGVGDSMELPDPAPILEVMKIVEPIMAGMKGIA
ncbi:MAG: D-amino-acid oxidase [Novosphingobium sp. SCN 63-17]|nr:MAG: D-amino-acid oxidase [Novosphingobium sp. SCN 63-17]OJX89732.1 MAG: D-amino-acid oxidase [Novosphingobium sp. 63-713]